MHSFSEYIDRVKAEPELKEKTKMFVFHALSDATCQNAPADSGTGFGKGRTAKRKLLAAAAAVVACAVLAVGSYAFYRTPVNYVCLDINPSVELGVNAFDKVVSAEAYNQDGQRLLEGAPCMNLSVETAVAGLVRRAAEENFLAEDGSTVIAVTAESDSKKTVASLQDSGEQGARSALSAGEHSAVIFSDGMDLQLRSRAQKAGISPGKLRLILLLQALDPDITVEECKDAKMTELMTRANELLCSGSSLSGETYAETAEKIRDAAQQVQAARANAERTRNGTGGQEQSTGTDGQNQNQMQGQGTVSRQQTQEQTACPEPLQTQEQGGMEQKQPADTSGAEQNVSAPSGTASEGGGQSSPGPEETGPASGGGAFSGAPSGGGTGGNGK